MKLPTILLIVILGVTIIMGGFAFMYDRFSRTGALQKEVLAELINISESKARRIKNFLDERKIDVRLLSLDGDIHDIFSRSKGGNTLLPTNVEKMLLFYREINDYLNIILIDPDGTIIWTATDTIGVGSSIEGEKYRDTTLSELFLNVKKDLGEGISDPGYLEDDGKLSIFATAPVLLTNPLTEKRELIGVIALQIDNEKVEKLATSDVGIKNVGETYVVNRDRNNITPIKYESERQEFIDVNVTYRISSDQITNCFRDYDNYYSARRGETSPPVSNSGSYKNYADKAVLGAHAYILESGWCVISEVVKKDYYRTLPNFFGNLMIIYISSMGALLLIFTFMEFVFQKRRRITKN